MQDSYDPFPRGPYPVGVRTLQWTDHDRNRELETEIWYPARPSWAGRDISVSSQDCFTYPVAAGQDSDQLRQQAVRDADPAEGRRFLIQSSHGYAGHRRESSYACTHLASHGYIVVAPDYPGSTTADINTVVSRAKAEGRRFLRTDLIPQLIEDRKHDVPFVFDKALAELDCVPDRVGITGVSFGGWTSLMAPSVDNRIIATVPMCPSGGKSPVYPRGMNHARNALDFRWPVDTAALFLVGDEDSWLPLYGQIELFKRTPGQRQMLVLRQANHNHFVDDVETNHEFLREYTGSLAAVEDVGGPNWSAIADTVAPYDEMCPGELANMFCRGACLAHMDAYLGGNQMARSFLNIELFAHLQKLGIDAVEISAGKTP